MAKKDETAVNAYPVLKNLKHDGKRYRPGDSVELSADTAAALIQIGTVAQAVVEKAVPEKPVEPLKQPAA